MKGNPVDASVLGTLNTSELRLEYLVILSSTIGTAEVAFLLVILEILHKYSPPELANRKEIVGELMTANLSDAAS